MSAESSFSAFLDQGPAEPASGPPRSATLTTILGLLRRLFRRT
jgi:hypothetical protein